MLNGLLAVVSLGIAVFCLIRFQRTEDSTIYAIVAAVFGVLMVVFGVMFLAGRINKTEDIHITE